MQVRAPALQQSRWRHELKFGRKKPTIKTKTASSVCIVGHSHSHHRFTPQRPFLSYKWLTTTACEPCLEFPASRLRSNRQFCGSSRFIRRSSLHAPRPKQWPHATSSGLKQHRWTGAAIVRLLFRKGKLMHAPPSRCKQVVPYLAKQRILPPQLSRSKGRGSSELGLHGTSKAL